jgi:hypothetical protein
MPEETPRAEQHRPDPKTDRLPDHGPVYTETLYHWEAYKVSRDPELRGMGPIIEPCNAATAFVFVFIAVIWLVRIRGKYSSHLFLLLGLAILLAGGVGGTLYHAFRRWGFAFYLDVLPIAILATLGSLYIWIRLFVALFKEGRPEGRLKRLLSLVAIAILPSLPFQFIAGIVARGTQPPGVEAAQPQSHQAVMFHYAGMAVMVVTALVMALIRTRGRHMKWITLGLVCFGFGILFRFLDPVLSQLPTGTHWLWHLGGAATTQCLLEYYYRIETEPLTPLPPTSS